MNSFKKDLDKFASVSENNINIVLGKYDVCFIFESATIKKNMYSEDGLIHFRLSQYYEKILEAHTELMQKPENEQIEPLHYENRELGKKIEKFLKKEENLEKKENLEDNCFRKVKKSIEKAINASTFQDLPYLKETMWLLYEDYAKNMASEFSYPWSIDLEYAFYKSIEYMEKIVKGNHKKSEKIEFIQSFIDSVRQTILHISQAGRLYFETPNSHLKQTGAYSKILYAYYGIIKDLLTIAYHIPKFSAQSEIIPFITFTVKPKAESEFFESFNILEQRVVNFELPYDAFTDLPKYAKLLSHEVFHYIAPPRRDIRNYVYGCIIWTEVIKSICYQRIVSLYNPEREDNYSYDRWKTNTGIVIRCIREEIWNSVLDNYDKLMPELNDNEKQSLWSKYYYKIDEEILPNYQETKNNILKIFNIIYTIWEKKKSELIDLGKLDADFNEVISAISKSMEVSNAKSAYFYWHLTSNVLSRIGTKPNDIIEASREAFADYFMIQVMGIDEKEYLNTTFEFVDIYGTFDEMQVMEKIRIGIVLDYIWSKDGELTQESLEEHVKAIGLKKDQLNELEKIWNAYEEYGKLYRKAFHYLLKLIDLDYINLSENSKLSEKVDKFRKKLVNYTKTSNYAKYKQPSKECIFKYNKIIIENMQNQNKLEKLFDRKNLESCEGRAEPIETIKKEFYIDTQKRVSILGQNLLYQSISSVRSLEDFMSKFSDIIKDFQDDSTQPLWFRGHSSDKYQLIPSLYRNKDNKKYAYRRSLKTMLEDLTNAFRVNAFHVPEIFPKGNDSLLGTMVSMQHYKVDTNLLDWSQQIFSALYFALEKYVNDPEKEPDGKTPRIYILNPVRFNTMMKELLGAKVIDDHYIIPALLEDDNRYANYLPFLTSKISKKKQKEVEYNYPFALYAPYVNPRIKAQAGCFTIFSVNIDVKQKKQENSYMEFALEALQDKCKEKVEKQGEEFKPFLMYIDIRAESVKPIARSIRVMGVTKKYIYPELETIVEEMKLEIKDSYKRDEKK